MNLIFDNLYLYVCHQETSFSFVYLITNTKKNISRNGNMKKELLVFAISLLPMIIDVARR